MADDGRERFSKALTLVVVAVVAILATLLIYPVGSVSAAQFLVLASGFAALSCFLFFVFFILSPLHRWIERVPEFPWYHAPFTRLNSKDDPLQILVGKELIGIGFQLIVYLFYVIVFAAFFYVLGEPFTSSPGYLLWGSFSAAILTRVSRYLPEWSTRVSGLISEFLLPFGIILAFGLWLANFGGSILSPQAMNVLSGWTPLVLLLFPVYLGFDAGLQTLVDRKPRVDEPRRI